MRLKPISCSSWTSTPHLQQKGSLQCLRIRSPKLANDFHILIIVVCFDRRSWPDWLLLTGSLLQRRRNVRSRRSIFQCFFFFERRTILLQFSAMGLHILARSATCRNGVDWTLVWCAASVCMAWIWLIDLPNPGLGLGFHVYIYINISPLRTSILAMCVIYILSKSARIKKVQILKEVIHRVLKGTYEFCYCFFSQLMAIPCNNQQYMHVV